VVIFVEKLGNAKFRVCY